MLYSCSLEDAWRLKMLWSCRILFIWLNMSGKVFVFTRFTNTSRFKQVMTIRLNIDFLEEVWQRLWPFLQSLPYSALSEHSQEKLPCCLGRKVDGRDTPGWFLLSPWRQCLGSASMLLYPAGCLRQILSFPASVTGVCMSPRAKVCGFETEVVIVLWQMHSPESLNVLYNNKSFYWIVGCYGKGSRGADLRHSM